MATMMMAWILTILRLLQQNDKKSLLSTLQLCNDAERRPILAVLHCLHRYENDMNDLRNWTANMSGRYNETRLVLLDSPFQFCVHHVTCVTMIHTRSHFSTGDLIQVYTTCCIQQQVRAVQAIQQRQHTGKSAKTAT
eukprot:4693419-Amphidinium_carterae.1